MYTNRKLCPLQSLCLASKSSQHAIDERVASTLQCWQFEIKYGGGNQLAKVLHVFLTVFQGCPSGKVLSKGQSKHPAIAAIGLHGHIPRIETTFKCLSGSVLIQQKCQGQALYSRLLSHGQPWAELKATSGRPDKVICQILSGCRISKHHRKVLLNAIPEHAHRLFHFVVSTI